LVFSATAFPDEARDFTPWLSTHLDLLAEALGLDDLQLVGTEHYEYSSPDRRTTVR
jgi:hypothetical protein